MGHLWNISSPPTFVIIARSRPRFSMPPYSFEITGNNDQGPFNTTLSLTVFAGFNGTIIDCIDPDAVPGEGDKQRTIAMVFGESLNATPSTYAHYNKFYNVHVAVTCIESEC